ncbi:MAG TPA: DUF4412 domain-containing protein [Chitinophagales bacterium]|nr:DUF4412 domain-containing protein [Chitinophagales bacterium]
MKFFFTCLSICVSTVLMAQNAPASQEQKKPVPIPVPAKNANGETLQQYHERTQPKTVQNTTTKPATKPVSKPSATTKPATTANSAVKPYEFLGSFTVNFDNKNKLNKSTTGKIAYAFDNYQAVMIPTFDYAKDLQMRAIVDKKENEITTLTTDAKQKKSGLLLRLPTATLDKTSATEKAKAPVIQKTGITKMIQGYKCEKTLITPNDSTSIEAWITQELNLPFAEALTLSNSGFKGKSPFGKMNAKDIKGTSLETIVTQKDGTTLKITVTEIKTNKPNAALFSTTGFNIMDGRGLPMFNGQ